MGDYYEITNMQDDSIELTNLFFFNTLNFVQLTQLTHKFYTCFPLKMHSIDKFPAPFVKRIHRQPALKA